MVHRLLTFGGGILVGAIAGLLLGGLLGAELGDWNAEIDFCVDDGTSRYIQNDEVRTQSCR